MSDEPPKGQPAETAAGERVTARTAELKRPNPERDVVSGNANPRKRARVDRESVALARKKPTRNKKVTPVSKPEEPEASRVRKTYRRRQKAEWSSPAQSAIRDVDYDEVPPSTVQLSSLTTKGHELPAIETVTTAPVSRALRIEGKNGKTTPTGPPQMGTKPTVEPDDKTCASIGKPKECDPCAQFQCLPTASILEDDDSIQSFSSSPHSPPLVLVDMPVAKVISAFRSRWMACSFFFSLRQRPQLQVTMVPPPDLFLELSLVQS